jgi:hypothetical protein
MKAKTLGVVITTGADAPFVLARKMHGLGRIKRKTLMLRMIELVSQISAVFGTPASTNDSVWLRGGL